MKKYFFEEPTRSFLEIFILRDRINKIRSIRAAIIFFIVFFSQSIIPKPLFGQINFSFSYFNISRNNGGGSVEQGDTLEVHALAYVFTGTTVSNLYYTDSIRTGTQYIPGTMKIISNEGVTVSGVITDKSGDDQGVYDNTSVPARLRVNIGSSWTVAQSGAGFLSTSGGGTITGGQVPIAGPGTLGIVAYRLVVTANYGDTLHLGGNFYYNNSGSFIYHFNYDGIKIIQNQGFCPNFLSASFSAESSFGTGNLQNRAKAIDAPGYTKVNITANTPNDDYYDIVNNTSADGTTNNTVSFKPNPHRVFGAWDIIGDHTGAANTAVGNLPVPPGTNGGYMLLVNANYNTGLCYVDTIKGLCPNTYYEYSAWVRNLCGQCGADINGNPYPPPTHGVMPNLTYTINDVDYYTSGNIQYTGTWVKRGFMYKTGPAETSFVIGIKNNASGGDGNDWVLDDINLATCYPNLIMNPNDTASACAGFPITITDTVKSYYNNYGNFQWQVSKDSGNTWIPVSAPGSITPLLVNGIYQYYVDTVFTPVASDSGSYFRLEVATTPSNLSDINCSVDNSQQVFLKVFSSSCSTLYAKILNFAGSAINNQNVLQWIVDNEESVKEYIVEKSTNGINFEQIGIVTPQENRFGDGYIFTDPENISNINYYRLKLINQVNTASIYSKTILIYNRRALFSVVTNNPFVNNLRINIYLPEQSKVDVNLCDMYGNILSKQTLQLGAGNSLVNFDNLPNLPVGMYILNVFQNGQTVQKKLIKEY